MLKLYNTLTRKKEEFIPQEQGKIKMYTCGVTVYDDCHIGHARSLYIFDVIRRYLKYRGFKVTLVRNITDIDDKIINRANELQINWKELVEKYIAKYYEDLNALGIEKADVEPRATGNIPDMIQHIASLIQKGFAYEAGGDVYFNVRKFVKYGQLSGQKIEEMESGVRIDPTELKKDPLDFALWKRSKENEPFWESPWGNGRPGWHIECSVMSQKYLKTETLDIHAGGRDLVFPHHENETAQAEALTGKPFAKYWIHHGLLTINGQKMSKSLGNFITIKNFLEQFREADILKLFFLPAHYSQPVDYTNKNITEAKQRLEGILLLERKIEAILGKQRDSSCKIIDNALVRIREEFEQSMDDDFNTAEGLAALSNLKNLAYKRIEDKDFVIQAASLLSEFQSVFNLSLNTQAFSRHSQTLTADAMIVDDGKDDYIQSLIARRNQARKNKDFAAADRIRKELESKGIILEDTKEGTVWRRKL